MNMQKGLIGVIVPVYKVEKYIAECIESILAQTYSHFRLILVDDGTPDNAGKICDEYAKKDSRITVIHQENAGVTRARARGVEEAEDCEFITFVDGDDMIAGNALTELYGLMNNNTDIVMCSAYYTETEEYMQIGSYNDYDTIGYKDYIRKVMYLDGGMPWGKLFRRELFDTNSFDIQREIVFGEDALMNIRAAFNSKKSIRMQHSPLYFYRQHDESCCRTFSFSEEYEEMLLECIFKSIPANERENFKDIYIRRELWAWERRYSNFIHRPRWSGSAFHKKLLSYVRSGEYNIGLINKMLLKHTNPFVRAIIIYCRKTITFLTRK